MMIIVEDHHSHGESPLSLVILNIVRACSLCLLILLRFVSILSSLVLVQVV